MNCEMDALRLRMIRQTEAFLEQRLNGRPPSFVPTMPPRRRARRNYFVLIDSERTCKSSHGR